MTNDDPAEPALPPLTRTRKKGIIYVRPPRIEHEIIAALDLPIEQAYQLAAAGRLSPQALIFFLRRFRPAGRSPAYDAMFKAFFARVERAGDRYLSDIPRHWHERAHTRVGDKILEWMSDDRMDIFEVSFRSAVEGLYLDARSYLKLRIAAEKPIEDFAMPNEDLTGEDVVGVLYADATADALPLAEVRLELQSALGKLKDEEQTALLYVDGLGLTEKQAAKLMNNCSDRKVRYLLKRARQALREIKDLDQ